VAATDNGVIGKAGSVPWHLPAELAYFRKITMGHPIIMGRKTYESINRSLPGRLNIVLTRQKNYQGASGVVVVHSLKQALEHPSVKNEAEVFIIGGQEVFKKAMALADKLYLTTVHTDLSGDRFFVYEPHNWKLIRSQDSQSDKENPYSFTAHEFVRK
jgi:dihydrofolate reductase